VDSKAEREHIVRWSDDPEDLLTVYTFRERAARKLLRAGAILKREGKRSGKVVSWTLEMPREWFRWPHKPRAATGARLEVLRKAREARLEVLRKVREASPHRPKREEK